MNIPTQIHEGLTAHQRIRASISAMARGDEAELQTLKTTCPKKSFLMNDPDYSDVLEKLIYLNLALEGDLQRNALDFLVSIRMEDDFGVIQAISTAGAIDAAWVALLCEMGIPADEMKKVSIPRHRVVETMITKSKGETNEGAVGEILELMRGYLAA